jgi:hypothetical protein
VTETSLASEISDTVSLLKQLPIKISWHQFKVMEYQAPSGIHQALV